MSSLLHRPSGSNSSLHMKDGCRLLTASCEVADLAAGMTESVAAQSVSVEERPFNRDAISGSERLAHES